MAKELPKLQISSDLLGNLFSTEEERQENMAERVTNLSLEDISPFTDHPFQVRDDEEMHHLIESIEENGVLVPALVRPRRGGGFEMIAGHRRLHASERAGLTTIPCIIRELSDDAATIIMVDSNLQREHILPSEKARAYQMRLEAMKRQGKRTDLTSVPVAQKLKGKTSRELLSEQVGESQDQVRRFIRLNSLIPELLKMVDEDKIALRPAVELSYLSPHEQESLLNIMEENECTPSLSQAIRLKGLSKKHELNASTVNSLMVEKKPNQKERISIAYDELSDLIPKNLTSRQMTQLILEALKFYKEHGAPQRDDRNVFYGGTR